MALLYFRTILATDLKKLLLHITVIVTLSLVSLSGMAQNQSDSLFYFRGKIYDAEDMKSLSNVHVINERLGAGAVSSLDGSFRIASRIGDSLTFSLIGYGKVSVIVSSETGMRFKNIITMRFDPIGLATVTIYGKTFAQFREDFRLLKITPLLMHEGVLQSIQEGTELLGNATGSFGGPIQLLYDRFNKTEVLRRKLENNRKDSPFMDVYKDYPTSPSLIPDTIDMF